MTNSILSFTSFLIFQEIFQISPDYKAPKVKQLSIPERKYHYRIPFRFCHNPTEYVVLLQDNSLSFRRRKDYLQQEVTVSLSYLSLWKSLKNAARCNNWIANQEPTQTRR